MIGMNLRLLRLQWVALQHASLRDSLRRGRAAARRSGNAAQHDRIASLTCIAQSNSGDVCGAAPDHRPHHPGDAVARRGRVAADARPEPSAADGHVCLGYEFSGAPLRSPWDRPAPDLPCAGEAPQRNPPVVTLPTMRGVARMRRLAPNTARFTGPDPVRRTDRCAHGGEAQADGGRRTIKRPVTGGPATSPAALIAATRQSRRCRRRAC